MPEHRENPPFTLSSTSLNRQIQWRRSVMIGTEPTANAWNRLLFGWSFGWSRGKKLKARCSCPNKGLCNTSIASVWIAAVTRENNQSIHRSLVGLFTTGMTATEQLTIVARAVTWNETKRGTASQRQYILQSNTSSFTNAPPRGRLSDKASQRLDASRLQKSAKKRKDWFRGAFDHVHEAFLFWYLNDGMF